MNGRFFAGVAMIAIMVSAIGVAAGPVELPARVVVRKAQQAVERDSVDLLAQQWRAKPNDRLARLGLATIARLTYHYDDAEALYRALIPVDPFRTDAPAAYALLGLALQADTRGVLPEAEVFFRRARTAARFLGDSLAESEALMGWAMERAPVAGMDVGLAILDTAAALMPADAFDLQAQLLSRRGVLRAVSGQAEAEADVIQARAFARRAGDLRLEARALGVLSVIPASGRKLSESRSVSALLDTAAMLQRKARDHSGLAETLLRHADVAYGNGDLGRFKQLSSEAEREAALSHNNLASRSISLGLGALALLVHDFAAADEYLTRAIAQSQADGDTEMMMQARAQRLYVYLPVGAIDSARHEAEAVLAYHRTSGDFSAQFEDLRTLVAIHLRAGDVTSARRTLAAAAAIASRAHDPRWGKQLGIERGAVDMAEGNPRAAIRDFNDAVSVLDTAEHIGRYELQTRLAEAYAIAGDYARAELELVGAEDELDRWRTALADPELRKMAFQVSPRPQNNRNASIANIIALLATHGHADAAFRIAERRRARELTDHLVRATALADSAAHDSAAHEPKELVAQWIHPAADVDALVSDRHTMLLEYVTGILDAPTTLFIVTRDSAGGRVVRARILPSADSLAPQIERFVALIDAGTDPSALSRSLGTQLLDPAFDALGSWRDSIVRATIVPDGPLHRVPFDALRERDGRYVMEHLALSLAPSGSVVPALRRRAEHGARARGANSPVRLLAIGNPLRPPSDTLPALPGAEQEVALVGRYAESDVWYGASATPAALRAAPLGEYRALHFATHAMVDDRSDANTALVLASSATSSGLMSPGEIAALPLDADLVVLSACYTAGGVVVDGEGVQGLALAFMQAGARSIVATQWRIDDAATTRFIHRFYQGLAQKLPVTDALRQAKLDAIRRGAAPREWAAFTVVGDPLVQIPFREPAPARRRMAWMAALLVAIVAGSAFFAFRSVTRNG